MAWVFLFPSGRELILNLLTNFGARFEQKLLRLETGAANKHASIQRNVNEMRDELLGAIRRQYRLYILFICIVAIHKKERPNLLSSSNRSSAPTVDILSSLENRQKLRDGSKFSRKKMWSIIFLTITIIGVTGFLQFELLQSLSVNIVTSLSSSGTTSLGVKPLISANTQSEVNESRKLVSPSIVDDVKTTLEPSAILIDIPSDIEKPIVLNEAAINSQLQKTAESDSKESQSTLSTSVGSATPKSNLKTKAPLQDLATKKQAIEKENGIERKSKNPLKMNTTNEKNHLKTYDNDIALLSALVANTSKSREEFSSNVSNLAGSKKTMAPPINLDVVERNSSSNTKNLLARCEKLGGMEAKLCHDRICSGSWQSESACLPSKG